mmetsp:Transcript_14043/g.23247  ORF Transcript_14043/g.23247 Transcript_14043/m.23247 type:complete len:383 (+) Transcript_14043:128-1276(+)|eukprot:CAMPEP_0184663480 /NCGR_PEP_ID=MMETSP0308-20130426/48248_1 /TAXON_ID=38269 /ORGANISM="Gloeochaete witrockiana, Strain SAG 46.84" /LENGTH=382 /DNA_ID=CAMNT_0027106229 /DNA_START=117 /DNA_END=1265 /DNA_ORIENTATION=+
MAFIDKGSDNPSLAEAVKQKLRTIRNSLPEEACMSPLQLGPSYGDVARHGGMKLEDSGSAPSRTFSAASISSFVLEEPGTKDESFANMLHECRRLQFERDALFVLCEKMRSARDVETASQRNNIDGFTDVEQRALARYAQEMGEEWQMLRDANVRLRTELDAVRENLAHTELEKLEMSRENARLSSLLHNGVAQSAHTIPTTPEAFKRKYNNNLLPIVSVIPADDECKSPAGLTNNNEARSPNNSRPRRMSPRPLSLVIPNQSASLSEPSPQTALTISSPTSPLGTALTIPPVPCSSPVTPMHSGALSPTGLRAPMPSPVSGGGVFSPRETLLEDCSMLLKWATPPASPLYPKGPLTSPTGSDSLRPSSPTVDPLRIGAKSA